MATRTEWAVTVEMTSDHPLTDDNIDTAIAQLEAHHLGAVTTDADGRTFSTTITVTGTTLARAAEVAVNLITAALPIGWHPQLIEAMTLERQDLELARPTIPELIGVAEAAEIAGVSRQRISALATSERGPKPVQTIAAGPLWVRSSFESWAAQPRQGGRPPRVHPETAREAAEAFGLPSAMAALEQSVKGAKAALSKRAGGEVRRKRQTG